MFNSCPFCGTKKHLHYSLDRSQGEKYGYVECSNCGAKGPDVRTNYKNSDNEPWHKHALSEWNGRHV